MKLINQKEINIRVQEQKKAEIDSGVFLARKIDNLRQDLSALQKQRDDFITGSQKVITDSLTDLQKKDEELKKEVKQLLTERAELLEPLDAEWEKVKEEKSFYETKKEELRLLREQLSQDEKEIEKQKDEISKISERTRYKESEVEKARSDIFTLKELAQKEYELAENNRKSFEMEIEKHLSELNAKIDTYQNGIALYDRKEKDLVAREQKLLSDKRHLETQQRTLRIAYEVIKKNGNASSTNDSK